MILDLGVDIFELQFIEIHTDDMKLKALRDFEKALFVVQERLTRMV